MISVVTFSLAVIAAISAYLYWVTRQKLAGVERTANAILESLVGGVLTLDPGGRVTIFNRAAREMLEIEPGQGNLHLDGLAQQHPSLADVIRQAIERCEYVQDRDFTFLNSRNQRLILRTSTSEQIDEAGRRVGVLVLIKDISKLVAMESELRRRDRLAAAGTLAAGVAHEIRNPLSALELNLRLLRDELLNPEPVPEDIRGYFDVLFAETRRLTRITSNFLQLSRPEPLTKAPVSAHDPLLQVMRLLEREAQEKKTMFSTHLEASDVTVLADATKLEQVCLNILINAMQAMPEGGLIRVSSAVTNAEDRRMVNLSFADQGIGIPAEHLPRLFDPYFTTRPDGTGLGLAIADRIVTDHGGRIFVDSTVGIGTTMTVSLPLAGSMDRAVEQEPVR
jgi:signal transduction histidine kinase